MKKTGTYEATIERIRSKGLRVTTPRRAILGELETSSQYISAEEIYLKIHPKYPKIGLATVYRTLTLLAKIGLVTKFEFGDGKARYELSQGDSESKHHHVLVCEECYKVIRYSDFSAKEKKNFEQLEALLAARFDFEIQRHVVHYYGLCSDCRS